MLDDKMVYEVELIWEFGLAGTASKLALLLLKTKGLFTTGIQLVRLQTILVDNSEAVYAGRLTFFLDLE